MKKCTKCKQEKEYKEFGKSSQTKDGFRFHCNACRKQESLEYCKKYPDRRKLSSIKYYKNHKEQCLESSVRWQKENNEKYKEISKIWRSLNKKRCFENTNRWTKENPGKSNAKTRRYQAAKLNATPSWLSSEMIKEMESIYIESSELSWLSDGGLHVDHIIPLQGKNVCGLHVPWNLQILPAFINRTKSAKM